MKMTESAHPPGRNPAIDLIRGISILLVVIHHTALRIPLMKTGLSAFLPEPLLVGLSWDGYEAVFAFFVVSGFLITGTSIRRWGQLARLDLRRFYVRRAARILPCLLVLVAILSLLDLAGVPNYTIDSAGQSLPRAVLAALALHLNWYEGRTGYLPGGWNILWSLSIEEVFYLAFPLLCRLIRNPRLLALPFAALALSLPSALDALSRAPEIWREEAYLPGMAAIAMGVCAALLAAAVPAPGRRLAAGLGWLATTALAALFWWEGVAYRWLGTGTMLVLTGSVALLLIACHAGWGTPAARGTAVLRSFGAMSYEVYLSHMFIVFPLVGLFHLSGGNLRLGWLWFIPGIALTWCLGRLVTRFLSSPADHWITASPPRYRQPLPTPLPPPPSRS